MNMVVLALIGIGVMLVLMFLRMPVSFALVAIGLLGSAIVIGFEPALSMVAADAFRQISSYGLSVVPLFVLMGQLAYRAGISRRLYTAAYDWIGSLPGGLAATSILASIGFSAVSGSNSATTATMGSVALPEMKRYKYDPGFAGASVAVGGTLGVVIPPSTALIIIAIQSEQSITKLFTAALVPGLIVGVVLVLTAILVAWRRPELGPRGPKVSWGARLRALTGVIEVLILFLLVIGGLALGWFTPTEAGAVGAFGVLVTALVTRQLTIKQAWMATLESLRISAMVLLLIAGAVMFGRFLSLTRLPFDLAEWAGGLAAPAVVVLLVILSIYLIGGAFMDALGFLVISIPIFFPLVIALGYDPIWFTVIITLITTIGAISPPVGVNVFVVSAMDKSIDVVKVFKGTIVYYIGYATCIALFIAFPAFIVR